MGMVRGLEGGPDPVRGCLGDWRGVLTLYGAPGGSVGGVLTLYGAAGGTGGGS